MKLTRLLPPALMFAAVLSAMPARAATITFSTVPVGTVDPFVVSADGVSVLFTSAANFFVAPSLFSSLTGNVLVDADPIAAPLVMVFSQAVQDASLNYATNTTAPVPFSVQARVGGPTGTVVGFVTTLGAIPTGFLFPEGSISFLGTPFDTLLVGSPFAPNFAIDNLSFEPVPEPTSIVLVSMGGAALLARVRRQRRRAV